MRLRQLVVVVLAALAVASLSACQSTQSRSAELEEEGESKLLTDHGLKIGKESTEVEVTATRLLSDANGSAVVVGLRNHSGQNLVNVPILIEVLDAKGLPVYSNDIPGIEPALSSVPYIPARGETAWVNDQVLASAKPKSVKVTVGADADFYSGPIPEIEVSRPTIEGDPVSGLEATGDVINRTGEDQDRLLLYAIARQGGEVVAAGRGAIEHLKASTKPLHYDVFFIGDPSGAQIELLEFPALPGSPTE